MIVRPFQERDVEAVAGLWQALVVYHQALDANLPGAAPNGAQVYGQRLCDHLSDPYTCIRVAEADSQVVGFVLGMIVDLLPDIFTQEPAGFLADIYVDTTYRRRGVGRALVAELRRWFAQHQIAYFDWHVAAHNPEGIAFWRAMGGQDVMVRMRASAKDTHDDGLAVPDR